LIHINLMPREMARRQAAWLRYRNYIAIALLAFATLLLAAESYTRRMANQMDDEVENYQSQLSQLTRRHQEAKQLEKRRANLQVKLATIGTLERQRRGPAQALLDLSAATPERLWLIEIKETGGSASLVGKGLDNQTIAEFMRRLAASEYFSNVDLVEAKQVEEGQAKLKQFTISARVNYAGQPAQADASGGKRAPGKAAPQGVPGAPALPQRVAPVDPAAVPSAAAAAITVPLSTARTAAGVTEGRDAATARAIAAPPPGGAP